MTAFKTDDPYREGLEKIVMLYVNDYLKDPDHTLTFLGKSNVPLGVMMATYSLLSGKGEIEKLESLDSDVKEALWKRACEYVPRTLFPTTTEGGQKCQKKRENFCKALYLIRCILEH